MKSFPFEGQARRIAALAAGALLACAFAPLSWWPLAVLCPALLMYLWQNATPREAAGLGFWFNVGTFAAGTYWLYISIHIFGEAPIWLALVIMAALVAIMGLYHAVLGYAGAVAAKAGHDALARWHAGRVVDHRVVARMVSVRFLVAVARLLANGHLARAACANHRRLRRQCTAVGECWRARGGGVVRKARSARNRADNTLACRRGIGSCRMDAGFRQAHYGSDRARCHPAGSQMAREQSRDHPQALSRFDSTS